MKINERNNIAGNGNSTLKSGNRVIQILFFGQIAEITGTDQFQIGNINDTDQLVSQLNSMYPPLIHTQYVLALDKKMITGNTPLTENCTVALLPPFSGG
jgi:sulfur-carrier protein